MKVHVLCPLIMTPPPMTLHVTGNIFRSGLSSALDPVSEGDCEEYPELSEGESGSA